MSDFTETSYTGASFTDQASSLFSKTTRTKSTALTAPSSPHFRLLNGQKMQYKHSKFGNSESANLSQEVSEALQTIKAKSLEILEANGVLGSQYASHPGFPESHTAPKAPNFGQISELTFKELISVIVALVPCVETPTKGQYIIGTRVREVSCKDDVLYVSHGTH